MKRRDRPRGVALQVIEERRRKARRNAFEYREVQLQQLLDLVEDAPDHVGRGIARDLLDASIGKQVDVELGARLD